MKERFRGEKDMEKKSPTKKKEDTILKGKEFLRDKKQRE